MILTFYHNKLLRHPQRLCDYLQGKSIMPLTLDFDLTNRCNCKCPGCVGTRQNETETLDTLAVVRLFNEAKDLGIKSVVFTGGGEPTMHPDVAYLLSKAKEIGLQVAIVSNGVILVNKPDIVESIVKNCTWIRVSLDAGNRDMYEWTHGVDKYADVIRGLNNLVGERGKQDSSITIGTAFLTSEDTVEAIYQAAHDVRTAGVDYLYLRPFLDDTTPVDVKAYSELNNDHFKVIGAKAYDLLHLKEKRYPVCGFGWWSNIVQADGDVIWCCRTRANPKFKLGNIYENNLKDILKHRRNVKVDLKECTILCKGDEVNDFLYRAQTEVMHEAFL